MGVKKEVNSLRSWELKRTIQETFVHFNSLFNSHFNSLFNSLLVFTFYLLVAPATQAQGTQFVNPFIGTGGMGHTFPGACYPYGFVQLSPDTDTIPHNIGGVYQPRVYDYCAGYQYRDSSIVGFSHTHFSGTGHSDLGDFLLMPYTGETKLNPGTADNPDGGYRQRFRHETEHAEPGYYTVLLDDDSIRCEFTATARCGVHRYIFPKGKAQKIILDLNHSIYNYDGKVLWAQCQVTSPRTLNGWRMTSGWNRSRKLYYHIRFNKPIKQYGFHDFAPLSYQGFWNRFDQEHNFPEMAGRKPVCWFEFEDDGSDTLEIIVGLSPNSTWGANQAVQREGCLYSPYASWKLFRDGPEGDTLLIVRQGDPKYRSHFDVVRELTHNKWDRMLGRIGAQGPDAARAMLYTSLYHTMINPSIYQDIDEKNYDGHTRYTIFSLWDTYRALHPLINLLDTTMSRDIALTLYHHSKGNPHHMLPVWSHHGGENWCMIGYHGVSVMVDAAVNTLHPDTEQELETMDAILSTSNVDYYDYTGLYKQIGYVPMERRTSAGVIGSRNGTSVTLENAYEDWCVYWAMMNNLENALPDIPGYEDSVRESYRQRALSYRNVFKDGMARARYSDGSWKSPYSLLSTSGEGFIEGNSWNYSFYVPHDILGLMRLMGGERAFVRKLDTLFTMYIPDEFFAETEDVTREGMLGGYVHGNEPSHHIPYLYMWTTEPWKTQYWVREIMNRMYGETLCGNDDRGSHSSPKLGEVAQPRSATLWSQRAGGVCQDLEIPGLCGNDDCGQMSAWYVFSAMGFYPVCPGSGQYILGAPYLPYLKVRMGSGKYLEIKASNVSDRNRYIHSVRLNGKPHTRAYLTYQEIMDGGVLEFDMCSKPNRRLFQSPADKPYSLSAE